jgi:hypothetical protein
MKRIIIRSIAIAIAVMLLMIAISSFHHVGSARVTAEDGGSMAYRVYRSILGQVYIEDPSGVPLILYARQRVVTYPDGDVPIIHTRSWILLNPIRSMVPADPPLTLGFDPRLEIDPNAIRLNISPEKRISIRF